MMSEIWRLLYSFGSVMVKPIRTKNYNHSSPNILYKRFRNTATTQIWNLQLEMKNHQ